MLAVSPAQGAREIHSGANLSWAARVVYVYSSRRRDKEETMGQSRVARQVTL